MNGKAIPQDWQGESEAILVGMSEWRIQHPTATFAQIEAELDQRLSHLRARMLADLAVQSASAGWGSGTAAPLCGQCGAALQAKGKKKRKLHTRGGQTVELEREYGVCPACGQAIFPPR